MSTANKLTYLNTTKGKIKDSINLTGANIGNNDTFRSYSAKLRDSLVDIINNGTDELYDNFPKATGTGSEIELNNTYEAPMSIDLKGNTSQQTYSGKNLLNPSTLTTGTRNGITCSYDDTTKIITFNGTCTTDNTIFDFSSTTILFQANKTKQIIYYESGTLTNSGQFRSFNNDYAAGIIIDMTQLSSSNNKMMMSNTADVEKTRFSFRFNNGSVANNFKVKVMITNDDNTDFEPYVGGTASPNPDYPQNIEVVTGNNSVNICGKNLFNKDSANILNANVSNVNIVASANAKTLYIPIEENKTYTISKILSSRFRICTTDVLPTVGVSTSNFNGIDDVTGKTITTTTGNKYLCVYYYLNGTDTLTEQQILDSIQIEKGSTATTYEAYQGATYPVNLGSIELCKIDTYQDYIYKSGDKWYLHKEIGKVDLAESPSTKINIFAVYENIPNIKYVSSNREIGNGIAEKYCIRKGSGLSNFNNYFAIDINRVNFNVGQNIEKASGLFYYALATPTTTEITDTTLKGQLEAIYNAYSYNNQTNISQENAEQPFILNVSALLREE